LNGILGVDLENFYYQVDIAFFNHLHLAPLLKHWSITDFDCTFYGSSLLYFFNSLLFLMNNQFSL
jgi:hypothetical protein